MFVDTNVLISARIPEAPHHISSREALNQAIEKGVLVRISRQVMREYLAVMTRPQTWHNPLSREEILQEASNLLNYFEVLEDGTLVSETLIALCREVPVGGRQIHDANIVATMLAHGERSLLTLNISDFRRFSARIEILEVDKYQSE